MNVGERIRALRLKKELTQEELAIKAGLSKTAIWNYENSKRTPNLETVKKIAAALNIHHAQLTMSPEELEKLEPVIKKLGESAREINKTMVEAVQGFVNGVQKPLAESIQKALEPLRSEEMKEKFKALQEWLDHDVAFLLLSKEKAYYNGHPLNQEERQRILDMLKLLFPEYSEDLDDQVVSKPSNEEEEEREV